ncbi:MAG: hypothetical protein Q9186_005286 [Xanthomendoza sp. 1 TL-2023]
MLEYRAVYSSRGTEMGDSSMLKWHLDRLRRHTDPPISQKWFALERHHVEHEYAARQRLASWNVCSPLIPVKTFAAVKGQLVKHRRVRTATSRIVEMDVREVIANHPLPAVAIRMLFGKLHEFLVCVERLLPELIPSDINTAELELLKDRGNQRQQFHSIRDLLPSFRGLLRHLADLDQDPEGSILQQLGRLGVIVLGEVHRFIATAAFGDTDEILSPPEHLRRIWKPVGKERVAPEDGGQIGPNTKHLWRTSWRVRDCSTPSISEVEVQAIFGPEATLESHADERLPYECGANKYTLVEQDPFVTDCTEKGLFTTSGPSGTAYRYLNLWLVLGGSREKLPEVRFALAALILGGAHHSLAEVMAVSGPILGQVMPQSLEEMLEELVPRKLELQWRGTIQGIKPEVFQRSIWSRLEDRLG